MLVRYISDIFICKDIIFFLLKPVQLLIYSIYPTNVVTKTFILRFSLTQINFKFYSILFKVKKCYSLFNFAWLNIMNRRRYMRRALEWNYFIQVGTVTGKFIIPVFLGPDFQMMRLKAFDNLLSYIVFSKFNKVRYWGPNLGLFAFWKNPALSVLVEKSLEYNFSRRSFEPQISTRVFVPGNFLRTLNTLL